MIVRGRFKLILVTAAELAAGQQSKQVLSASNVVLPVPELKARSAGG